METGKTYLAFAGVRRIAQGTLADVVPALKQRFDRDPSESVLVFETESGRQVDFDLRGTVAEALARTAPARRPGRPKLGVTSREVSLLPRHWEWLEQQGSGISATLRRLVEQAMKAQTGKERARQLCDALCRFMTCMAGDRPNFEEACRSLYAGDGVRFAAQVERWPKDIREYVLAQEQAAERAAKSEPA